MLEASAVSAIILLSTYVAAAVTDHNSLNSPCNPDVPEVVYYPVASECNAYWICRNGTGKKVYCPKDLHFYPERNICDVPTESNCLKSLTDAGVSERCPKKNGVLLKLLPHETDCHRYYICDSGVAYLKSCPEGLHFNRKKFVCDHPENAGCEDPTSGDFQYTEGLTDSGISERCPKKNGVLLKLLPHETDCHRYYICDSGVAYLKSCPEGLHFNRRKFVCDHPENAGCEDPTGQDFQYTEETFGKDAFRTRSGTEHPKCPATDPDEPVLLPHEYECNKFYICHRGVAHEKTCLPGLHFNRELKVCDYPENAKCENSLTDAGVSERCPKNNGVLLKLSPHETDCHRYYICNSGTAHLKSCPKGLHFNRREFICDHPENAGCEDPKGRDFQYAEGLTDATVSERCPKQNGILPKLLPHESDCHQYYVCENGNAHLKICPKGLHFNRRVFVCDYPEHAGCEEREGRDLHTDATDYARGTTVHEASGSPSPFCPKINGKHPIFYRHETNCSVYYMCGNGLSYEFTCPSGLHFNLEKKTCDAPYKAGCRHKKFVYSATTATVLEL